MNRKGLLFSLLLVIFAVMSVVPAVAQDDPTQIEVWIAFTDFRLDWAVDRAAEFNEMYPEYEIVIQEFSDYEPLLEAYTLAQQQGNQPAAIQLFEVATQFALDSGWFKSVNEIIAGRDAILDQPVDFDDIVEVVSAYYTIDGEWASVAWNTSTPILYANMNLLSEAGVEEIPTTWQELEAACAMFEGMMEAGDLSGCITWPNHGWFFEQWLAQQNTLLTDNGNGRDGRASEIILTSDAAINILQWHKDMYNAGYYAYSGVQRDWPGTVQAFNAQQVPFIMTSSASAGGITQAAAENGVEVVTSNMVYDAEVGWTGNILGGATMWVSDGLDPEIEEVVTAFLLFFSNTENSADWHKVSGYVPVRNSSIELLQSEGWYDENPNFLVASTQLGESEVNRATEGAIFGTFVETRDIITQAIEDVMLTDAEVIDVLTDAEQEANILLEEYNLLYVEE